MTLVVDDAGVREAVDFAFILEAVKAGFQVEAQGGALPPSRVDVPLRGGWLRFMGVSVPAWDVYGVKLMNMASGVGVRYLIALYEESSGRLLGLLDAKTVTALRTAASAALAAQCLTADDLETIAIIGTGHEARRLLQAMLFIRPAAEVRIYSRSEANRLRFIEANQSKYVARLSACSSVEEAVDGVHLIALATKSAVPVLGLSPISGTCHVSSVGASRQDQAELAPDLLGKADIVVCDSVLQVFTEAGDVRMAVEQGELCAADATEMRDLLTGKVACSKEGLSIYKSVGTALQDVALAFPLLHRVLDAGGGLDIGEFLVSKPAD